MNPFVNPRKRSISLPEGCKDLVDVLNHPKRYKADAFRRFLWLVLLQAREDCAIELVIRSAEGKETPINYKIDGTWYAMSRFPSCIRPGVVDELARLANLPEGPFPKEGVLVVDAGETQLQWKVVVRGAAAACLFTPTGE